MQFTPRRSGGRVREIALFAVLGAALAAPQSRAEWLAEPLRLEVDGVSDDLLTAGLGAEGLRGPVPTFADPVKPTLREIRRRAIYQNYRSLVDVSPEGGFGTQYGSIDGLRIAGVELRVPVRAPSGTGRSTVMLQIPRMFDLAKPCLVVVASSGSRGIYGALPTAGEWGLRRGCAVAHTDKGTGTGLFEVDRAIGIRIDGVVTQDAADPYHSFVPPDTRALALLRQREPHSILLKHFHAGDNPEAAWGQYVVSAAQVALQLLAREFGARRPGGFTAANTLVIAAGLSNGGGAVLRAMEADRGRIFDGAVAVEPNVNVGARLRSFELVEGSARQTIQPLSLYEYSVLHAQLQRCAFLAESDSTAPLAAVALLGRQQHEQWCANLATAGLVQGDTAAAQAANAREALVAAGVRREALRLGALNVQLELALSVAATYASAYRRASVDALPCGFGLAAVDAGGAPRALSDSELATAFSDSSGIAPALGVMLVRADASGQRTLAAARSFEAVQCLAALRPTLRAGVRATEVNLKAGRRPILVLHGRQDALVPVNFSSRPYYVAAKQRGLNVRYYEIARGQHFDAFLPWPGMRGSYDPMQPHFNAALDALYAQLVAQTPLPPSQVVRAQLQAAPGSDRIDVVGRQLVIPE
jgi:hydroxybutyrate-dimer hydrolase